MGIVFVLGLISFITGLAGIGSDGNGFSVAGMILGACTMIVSLLSMAWPPPPRRDTAKILTSFRSALPGMVRTAIANENGPAEDMTITQPLEGTIIDGRNRTWVRNSEDTYNLTGRDADLNRNCWTSEMIEKRFGITWPPREPNPPRRKA